jgi:glycosyltransferase involved in cell wall biosynthesis
MIVGRDATLETIPLADQAGVTLAADVPAVAPYYERAMVAIAPLRFAAGTRIKILESLGHGVPMVSTTPGAAGLDLRLREGHGLTVRDDPAGFAAAIESVLAVPMPHLAGAERGAAVVRASYSWEAATRPVREMMETWISRGDR